MRRPMTAVLEHLAEGLADAELTVREEAAQELAELESEDAVPYLLHALEDDAASVRMWGAYGLTRFARPQDLEVLRERLGQEPSGLVRVWCAYGLANAGDRAATALLVDLLDDPDLDACNNCAEALLTLERPAAALPLLQNRLASRDPRVRTWAAGVLAGMGKPQAVALWREALLFPESRVDAAIVASHLHSPEAARDLLRLVAELDSRELEAPIARAAGAPLLQLLTSPLPSLGLSTLLGTIEQDPVLAGELLMLLARAEHADFEVVSEVTDALQEQPVKRVAKWMTALIEEQEPQAHPALFNGWSALLPVAANAALTALPEATRNTLFTRVKSLAHASEQSLMQLVPLIELLKDSDYSSQFQDLPEIALPDLPEYLTDPLGNPLAEDPDEEETAAGLGEEDGEETAAGPVEDDEYSDEYADEYSEEYAGEEDLSEEGSEDEESVEVGDGEELVLLVQQLAGGEELSEEQREQAEQFLSEIGMTAEEFVSELNQSEEDLSGDSYDGPRSAEQVASRALVLGAMLKRLTLEEALQEGRLKNAEAGRASEAVFAWIAEEGLEGSLDSVERDLLELPSGEWGEEDRRQIAWTAEGLHVLLWAIEKVESLPPADVQSPPGVLLARLPILESTSEFIAGSTLRDSDALERQRETYEVWLWRTEQEDLARQVEAGETPEAIDPEAFVDELRMEGFPVDKLEKQLGYQGMLAEGLRSLARRAAESLEQQGALEKRLNGDFPFRGKPFFKLDADTILTARSLSFEKHRALSWVEHGGSWEMVEEPFDD